MTQHLEGILFAIAFVVIVGGLAWYSRRQYQDAVELDDEAQSEAPRVADPEISQSFAKEIEGARKQ